MVNAENPDKPLRIFVKYHEHKPNLAILNGWHKREQKWSYVLEGNDKKTWDDYQFQHSLAPLPNAIKASMRAVEGIVLNASFQPFGCIMLSSFGPLNAEHFDLLIRLSKVFDLTYTRFLDLQLKEQQAVRLLDEKQKLEATLAELRATQTQLIHKEKLASLGELTAGIAHEIQNPLNFVNNFADVSGELVSELKEELAAGNADIAVEIADDLGQNLQKITHHGQRASSIVQGMLEHSRTSTGEKQPTNLNALSDEYLRLAYHGMRAKNKGFNADYKLLPDTDLPPINCVPQDIGRVLLNLLNNAFHAVGPASRRQCEQPLVTVRTERTASGVCIRILDNGVGMSASVRKKVFQPFFTTKPTGEGTGLGLSISYDIVTKGHGGTLEVESVEGEGTEFIMQLPHTAHIT